MRLRILAILVALGMLAVACGVPKSSKFTPIPVGNIPDALSATTSTTMAPTTSTIESISTTTTSPVPTTNPTEEFTLYFVNGQQIVPSPQFLPRDVPIGIALNALKNGPDSAAVALGLRTAIPKDSDLITNQGRGVVTVDLDPDFFTRMTDAADERLAIAQIVLTLANLRGVSQVRFTINNEPIQVKLGGGELSDPGQALVVEDYSALLGNSPPVTTTTVAPTTTTAPIDTLPPESLPSG